MCLHRMAHNVFVVPYDALMIILSNLWRLIVEKGDYNDMLPILRFKISSDHTTRSQWFCNVRIC